MDTRSSSCRAAQVSSERFHPGNSSVEHRGQVGQELQWSDARCPWGFVFIIPPTTSEKRGLNRFTRKHNKWPMARVLEEGREENVFAGHTAYKELSVPCSGLQPAAEGLKQLSEHRNRLRGILHVPRVFLRDRNCLQYNVPAPVGWCGFACCSALPEKLLIYQS